MQGRSKAESYFIFNVYNKAIYNEVFHCPMDDQIRTPHFNGYVIPVISALSSMGVDQSIPVVIGDNISEWPEHVFAKTRPSRDGNISILRLQPLKHWKGLDSIAQHDMPISQKSESCIFRGATTGYYWNKNLDDKASPRSNLMHAYRSLLHSNAQCNSIDIGFTEISPRVKNGDQEVCGMASSLIKAKINLKQMLSYKYVLTPEGNDVSTGLKSILASTSIPVMPAPTVESWLLEFDLVPWRHYVPVKNDFSDLEEVIDKMNSDQKLQEYISEGGREYISEFLQSESEELLNSQIICSFLRGSICN
jgi:hypothetical protein